MSEDEEFEFRARAEAEAAASSPAAAPAASAAPPKDEPRLLERLGRGAVKALPFVGDNETLQGIGGAAGLSAESSLRGIEGALRGAGGSDASKAAAARNDEAMKDVRKRQGAMPLPESLIGGMADPVGWAAGGGAGKLASMGPKVGPVLQALKSAGAAGGTSALLTPGDAEDRGAAGGVGAVLSGLGSTASGIWKKIQSSTTPEQRAALVKKAMDAIGVKMGAPTGEATQGAAANAVSAATKARTDEFQLHSSKALAEGKPIPTDQAADELHIAAAKDVGPNRRVYDAILDELQPMGVDHQRNLSIDPAKYENTRGWLRDIMDKGFDAGSGRVRLGSSQAAAVSKVLTALDKSAAEASPHWKKALDSYKANSPAVDRVTRSDANMAGEVTSKVAERHALTKNPVMQPHKAIGEYMKEGPAGMRAAAEATKGDKAARTEIQRHVVNDIISGTGSANNAWKEKSGDLVKSGLFSMDDATRVQKVVDEFDRVMRAEPGKKPNSVLSAMVGAIPGGKKVAGAVAGLNETSNAAQLKQARELLTRAALDPEYGKYLSALPTPDNMKKAMTAVQRAGAIGANRAAVSAGEGALVDE